jgi:hypothetical protein
MDHAGQMQIVGEGAAALQELVVLHAEDSAPDVASRGRRGHDF